VSREVDGLLKWDGRAQGWEPRLTLGQTVQVQCC